MKTIVEPEKSIYEIFWLVAVPMVCLGISVYLAYRRTEQQQQDDELDDLSEVSSTGNAPESNAEDKKDD